MALDETRGRITRDGIRIYEDADFAGMAQGRPRRGRNPRPVAPLVTPGATTGEWTPSSPMRSPGAA